VIFTLRRASQRQPRQAVKILSKSASCAKCPAPVATPGTHLRQGDGAALSTTTARSSTTATTTTTSNGAKHRTPTG